MLRTADATVVREDDWAQWASTQSGNLRVLATSQLVPGGFSVVVKGHPAETRGRLAQWFATSSTASGLPLVTVRPESIEYRRVAELGLFTPTSLPGVSHFRQGSPGPAGAGRCPGGHAHRKEFKAKRIRGALFAAYVERA